MTPVQTASITQNDRTLELKEPKVARRGKHWWLVVLPFVLWQVIALLFCELVLYSAGLGEEEIFKFDKTLGFRHFPDKIVTWRSEGFSRNYFNSDGMRDPNLTVAKPANTIRIALLGDSMTEALQVPFERSWGELLESKLGSVAGKNVQVVNFGNSGYSTTQECLLLEEKVFKYKPDLVVVGYSSRDIMENWAPPDETVSNVRPAALKIPGRELIIDTTPVSNWLKSPRARFLQSIEWFRHHSRVWGIISATELQLSMKEPIVKALLSFCTNPVRSSRAALRSFTALMPGHKAAPVVGSVAAAAVAPVSVPVPAPLGASVVAPVVASVKDSVLPVAVPAVTSTSAKMPVSSPAPSATAAAPVSAPIASSVKISAVKPLNLSSQLMASTIEGLIGRMNKDCQQHNAKFMMVALPCRADLSPYPGMQSMSELAYSDELAIVKAGCDSNSVPFIDTNSPASFLPATYRRSMFYGAHLTPTGNLFASQAMVPLVREVLSGH